MHQEMINLSHAEGPHGAIQAAENSNIHITFHFIQDDGMQDQACHEKQLQLAAFHALVSESEAATMVAIRAGKHIQCMRLSCNQVAVDSLLYAPTSALECF